MRSNRRRDSKARSRWLRESKDTRLGTPGVSFVGPITVKGKVGFILSSQPHIRRLRQVGIDRTHRAHVERGWGRCSTSVSKKSFPSILQWPDPSRSHEVESTSHTHTLSLCVCLSLPLSVSHERPLKPTDVPSVLLTHLSLFVYITNPKKRTYNYLYL